MKRKRYCAFNPTQYFYQPQTWSATMPNNYRNYIGFATVSGSIVFEEDGRVLFTGKPQWWQSHNWVHKIIPKGK